MKDKEKTPEGRGRPRKIAVGEEVRWGLRMPEGLLNELRLSARVAGHSINDEVLSRLMVSLNYEPKKDTVDTQEGKRLVKLSQLFSEFIEARLGELDKQDTAEKNPNEKGEG